MLLTYAREQALGEIALLSQTRIDHQLLQSHPGDVLGAVIGLVADPRRLCCPVRLGSKRLIVIANHSVYCSTSPKGAVPRIIALRVHLAADGLVFPATTLLIVRVRYRSARHDDVIWLLAT